MKKKNGPDLNKWKEFRYNLIKEDNNTNYSNNKYFDYQWGEGISLGDTDKIYYDKKNNHISYSISNTKGILNKNELEGLKYLLDKYLNIIKEDIEVDADREEDLYKLSQELEAENKFSYQLKNGKTLEIEEKDAPGMAGEPATYVFLSVDGKGVKFDDIKHLMKPNDARELKKYLDEISDLNAASIDNWVRENKTSKYFDIAKWRETHKK